MRSRKIAARRSSAGLPDIVSPEVRSRMMAGIRGRDTRPEMQIRKGLHARGWRYRLHAKDLPGRPDLVFPGRRAVIFVNGCFWHGHDCHLFRWPRTREDFWREKIAGNVARDRRASGELSERGWRIAEVWECRLKGREREPLDNVLKKLENFLEGSSRHCHVGPDRRVEVPPG